MHGGYGVQAHGGHVKPEVLVGLAHLDHHGAGTRQGAAPANGRVGAFDGLQGHHHLTPHHGALADVQTAQLPGRLHSQVDVGQLGRGGRTAAEGARGGQEVVQEEGGGGDGDAFGLHFVGHGPEEAVVLAGAGPADDAQGPPVGAKLPEEAAPADTAGHDCLPDSGGLENADDFAQLAHVNPVEFGNQGGQGRVSLPPVGHGDDAAPCCRAAWANRRGNCPLPAIKPMFSDIRREQAPLRSLQKRQEVADLGSRGQFVFDPGDGLFLVQLREEQELVGPFQGLESGVNKAMPFQTHQVEPHQLGPVAHGHGVGRDVPMHRRTPTHKGVAADMAKLVDGGEAPENGVVLQDNVTAQGRGVGHDDAVAHLAVVGHVGIGHEQVAVADAGDAAAAGVPGAWWRTPG